MADVFAVAETLVQHVKKNYANDIAIIAYYGSYAQGTATKRSDLDFFFIPAAPEGYRASIQFVLNEISYDFWPISWERAERMAALEEPQTTIIVDSQLLYIRSEEDYNRFMGLRDKTIALQQPQQTLTFIEKAESMLRDNYVYLYRMSRADANADLTFFRMEAEELLTNTIQSLALLNQTYFTKGWGKNREQIMSLPIKPIRLEQLHDIIIQSKLSSEIVAACEQLTKDTIKLVLQKKDEHAGPSSYPDRMKGFYEEIKGVLDKIITACEREDYDTAYYSVLNVQNEIAQFLFYAEKGQWPSGLEAKTASQYVYSRLGLPNLAILLDPHDFAPLQAAVEQLNERLENHLRAQGVNILKFDTLDQFVNYLNKAFENMNK